MSFSSASKNSEHLKSNSLFFKHQSFSVSAHEVELQELQMEIIEMQCDAILKEKFSTVPLDTFYRCLEPGKYPKMTGFASKILSIFGTTYTEQK